MKNYKTETIEEFLSRGKEIRKVEFNYKSPVIGYGRNFVIGNQKDPKDAAKVQKPKILKRPAAD